MDRFWYDWNIKNNKTHWWFLGRNSIISHIIKHYFKINSNIKILDVGCGSGVSLHVLNEFGEVFAIEPDDEIREYAQKENPNCKIYAGSFPFNNPIKEQEGTFDLITLLDVLEHIEDDKEALVQIGKMLRGGGGKIIITVPAFQFLFGKADVSSHHYRRYNYFNLKKLLIKAGFSNFKIYYFNTILFLPIVIARLLEKFFRNLEFTSNKNSKFLNNILFHIMDFEKFTLKLNPIGISLCAVIDL